MNDGGDFMSTQWWQLQILTDVRNFHLVNTALISLQVSVIASLPYDRNCHDKAFTVRQNSLLTGIKDKADLITVNLLEDPVRQLLPSLASHLNATGQVIISGILASRIQLLNQALPSQFTVQQIIITQE